MVVGIKNIKSIKTKQIRVKAGMKIAFTYRKLDGTMRQVKSFYVEEVFVSKSGQRIIKGWRGDGQDREGRSYRRYRMSNVQEV